MPACATEGRLLDRRSCIRLAAALGLAALPIIALGAWSNLDLLLADWLYDRAAGVFPWRDAWLTTRFGHEILKIGLMLLAACFVTAARS